MSCSSPTRRGVLLGALALGACGFQPAYGPGGVGRFRHATAITTPATPDGYRLLTQLEDRLGPARDARWHLEVTLDISESRASYGEDDSIGRATLMGEAGWKLTDGAGGPLVGEGTVRGFTGYDSGLVNTVALRTDGRDARERLAVILADAVVTQMLALGG